LVTLEEAQAEETSTLAVAATTPVALTSAEEAETLVVAETRAAAATSEKGLSVFI
jgi:hypothetical protein